jgi:hypothetical protein
MEAAKGLAAPLICVEAGPLPEPGTLEKPKPKVSPQDAGLIIIPETTTAAPGLQTSLRLTRASSACRFCFSGAGSTPVASV